MLERECIGRPSRYRAYTHAEEAEIHVISEDVMVRLCPMGTVITAQMP